MAPVVRVERSVRRVGRCPDSRYPLDTQFGPPGAGYGIADGDIHQPPEVSGHDTEALHLPVKGDHHTPLTPPGTGAAARLARRASGAASVGRDGAHVHSERGVIMTNQSWPLKRVLFALAGTVIRASLGPERRSSRRRLASGTLGVSPMRYSRTGWCPAGLLPRPLGLRPTCEPGVVR